MTSGRKRDRTADQVRRAQKIHVWLSPAQRAELVELAEALGGLTLTATVQIAVRELARRYGVGTPTPQETGSSVPWRAQ